jgi:hypothetical protein
MKTVDPVIVSIRHELDGTDRPIFGYFTSKSLELYPVTCSVLSKYNDNSRGFWHFVHELFDGADHARAWKRTSHLDPNEACRQDDIKYLADAPKIAAAGRKFSNFLKSCPERITTAIGFALLEMKKENGFIPLISESSDSDKVNIFAHGKGSHSDMLIRIIDETCKNIESPHMVKDGPFMHRFQSGPLVYHNPIDKHSARGDVLVNGLLFGAVLFARQFTARPRFLIQRGMVMPTPKTYAADKTSRAPGRPLWPVAAAIVSDVLNVHLTDNAARNRLTALAHRNPGLGWFGWPSPPADSFDRYA